MKKQWHVCYDCGYGEMGELPMTTEEVYDWFKLMGCTECGEQFTTHLIENMQENFNFRNFSVVHDSHYNENQWIHEEIDDLYY